MNFDFLHFLRDWLPVLRGAVLTIAAVVAIVVGVMGLNTWRRQLKGNTEYALAKSVLVSVFELREAIAGARHVFMRYSIEPDLPPEKLDKLDDRQKQWHALAQAYQRRWEPVAAAKAKLDANLLEIEAVWGRSLVGKIKPLSALVAELAWAIEDHLEGQNPRTPSDPRDPEEIKERRHTMFAATGKRPDPYKERLDEAISGIEAELRPHLLSHYR